MRENYFLSPRDAAQAVITNILCYMDCNNRVINIALSGGNTPSILFKEWEESYHCYTDWDRVCFYWVDERCVPPTDANSNFKQAYDLLLSKVDISPNNYYRIYGEINPHESAITYSSLVKSRVKSDGGVPKFDFVLLGIGDDGHTSSIFPNEMGFLNSKNLYEVMLNPYDNTLRVGMTGDMMIKAYNTLFFVIGEQKHDITHKILKKETIDTYPSSYVWHKAMNSQLYAAFK